MKTRNFHLLIFPLLILMALAISCSKKEVEEVKPTNYVIEGHLFRDCNLEPVVGKELFLIQNAPNAPWLGMQRGGLLDSVTTDSTGYYKFNYFDKNGYELFVRYRSGFSSNTIIHDIPKMTNFNSLDLFIFPMVSLSISLNVINSYSESDTLIIQDFRSKEGFKINGPFKSGVALELDSVYLFDMSLANNYFTLNYYLLPFQGKGETMYFGIDKFCDNTVYLTIDIE